MKRDARLFSRLTLYGMYGLNPNRCKMSDISYCFKIFILIVVILSGCSALLSEQKYVRVDEDLSLKRVWSGILFTIPEERTIHKIVIVGEGVVKNIEVQARIDKDEWRTVKKIKRLITFPYEIRTMVRTDAIRILQKTMAGRGRIQTIQLYSLVGEEPHLR